MGDVDRFIALEAWMKALEGTIEKNQATHEELFDVVRELQQTVDEGVNHLENWCERLQNALDEHLRVCVETASRMLTATQIVASHLSTVSQQIEQVDEGAPGLDREVGDPVE